MGCCCSEPVDFDSPVDITHFELLRSIGKGAFGKVKIVEHKRTKVQYALKYINKNDCAEQGLAKNIIRERNLLEEADSIFICNLRYAFQDDEHILMVLDLKLGGDLDFHLRSNGYFSEERAKFYCVEIICGITYLHSLKIVHRDLKPGNVLLDEFGHASITDFNIASHYSEDKPLSSRSGTLSYMAPEVINHIPYLNSIDWWSLGIMTFEMLYGYTPFTHSDDAATKKAIRQDLLVFPDKPKSAVSQEAISFLDALIVRDEPQRLGSDKNGGSRKVKQHSWFNGWDWEKAVNRELPVPFKPDVEHNVYCNPILELEEVLFESNPLQSRPVKYKTNKQRSSANILSTEESDIEEQLRLLNEEFRDYDFTKSIRSQESIYVADSSSQEKLV